MYGVNKALSLKLNKIDTQVLLERLTKLKQYKADDKLIENIDRIIQKLDEIKRAF